MQPERRGETRAGILMVNFIEHEKSPRLTFDVLRERSVARARADFKKEIGDWTPEQWLCALTGEVGELANIVKKDFRKLFETDNIPRQAFADEIADIAIYLDLLAARMGVDLGEAIRHKFNETSRKINSAYFL